VSIFGELWEKGKQYAGDGINDLAHLTGDGLNAVGLHGAAQWVDTEGDKAGYKLGADVPELQLGQTTDPAELVHGDPVAIRSSASRLREFSSAFGETAAGMQGLDTGHWTGAAADAFRAKFAPHPAKWHDAASATGTAAGALQSYAEAVETAQGQARQAIDLYQQGQRATATATAAYNQLVASYNTAAQAYDSRLAAGQDPGTRPAEPGALTDPGAALRDRAQQTLSAARSARNAAAATAEGKISAGAKLAPAEPSFWSQAGADLTDTLQAGNLASMSFDAGVVNGAADIVKFARSVDPVDPWNIEHPAEYVAGASGTLAGLASDVINPQNLAKGLVGTGWGSDPFQAAGKLVPNVALAVATDGAGAAADAGASVTEDAAASAGEEALTEAAGSTAAAQAPGEMTLAGDPVDVATGDVVLAQTDVMLPGVLPLPVERTHRSSFRTGRWLGSGWMSTFDQRLSVRGDTVIAAFADGRVLAWPRPPAAGSPGADSPDGQPVLPVVGPAWPLRQQPDGSWTVTDPQRGLTWRYERHPGSWWYPAGGGHGELPLASVTDRAGHQVSYDYDDDGAPRGITHSGGYRLLVTTAGGRVAGLALDSPGGGIPLVGYEYDPDGNLAGVVNSSGVPLRFSYDQGGRLAGWLDRNGYSYAYSYDGHGRCTGGEGPGGVMSGTFSYVPGATTWTDAAGAATVYQVDGSGRVAAVIDPLGGVTRREHDERGRVTAHADPLGRLTGYAYDGGGNLIEVARPDGSRALAGYDERGLPVRVTGPDGAVWEQEYDERGNRTRSVAPDGTVTAFGYDERGYLAAITAADGSVTRVTCGGAGLPVAVTPPGGGTTRYERDFLGRTVRVTAPDGAVTALAWTAEGRLAERVFPDNGVERREYDGEGNLTRHTSPAGAVTRYRHGPFGTLTALSRPDGSTSEFAYDHALRLSQVRHGNLTWRYKRDAAGRLAAETDYNGALTRYGYDAAGQLTSRVNACGQQLAFGYDLAGNLAWEDADGAVTELGYDQAGRLSYARNDDAEVTLERDLLGRVTAEACNGRVTRWEYDAAGRVTRRVTPSGAESAWEWGGSGLPAAVTAGGRELRFGYDQAGREVRRDLPGGIALTQEWDARGRLSAQLLAGTTGLAPGPLPGTGQPEGPAHPEALLQRRAYAYDPDGYVTGTSDLLAGDHAVSLDAGGRVTAVTGQGWAEHYAYDPAGNLAAATWPVPPPGPAAEWLEAGLQGRRQASGTLVTRAGNLRYSHDAAGRVTWRQRARISRKPETWHYQWDARGRLSTVTTPDGTTWRYGYDPFGRRVAKQHLARDGQPLEHVAFAWDGPVLAEQVTTTPATQEVTTWEHQPGTFTPLTESGHTTLRDAPQEHIDTRFYAIVTDLAGTPAELVSADGTLAGYQQHTLFGATAWHPRGAATRLRFPGQQLDPETGLHYNCHRYYDPAAGSYLTPDPLGLAPAPNPHAYVANPYILTDPLGLDPASITRNAPDFTASPSGITQDLRGLGRPDNQLVLSGHGGIMAGDGSFVTVPPGTSIAMYSEHGVPISDYLGNQIETASPPPLEVYGPGEQLPDYTLYPPDGLKILGMPRNITVTSATRLSELISANMGIVNWAACRSVIIP
jgi:RHS repeat-associated protein